ncbi:hypothetical protein [Rhizohabitans arisaemae]|uniref:hypothetical protein n=1 Tax=Rhizohabitans arisaemae TaxID=2720610 RepID=UPI0024B26A24|nr:hypothetical protein [Rhizohabitans arisaemae]
MRRPISKIAALALATPLVAMSMIMPAEAAPAASTAQVASVQAADEPGSVFSVKVTAPKTVKRGGKITYTIKATNLGPYEADYYYFGGTLPKGTTGSVTLTHESGEAECDVFDDGYWCWTPDVLQKGESDTMKLTVRLKKSTKGTVTAKLGVDSWDIPEGVDIENDDEVRNLEGAGVNSWYFLKTVKTKVVR